ncbi:MAG: helix-turn-helix domain-containing protein [Myxococcota bacterium]|nr:helix-turn-helix domain-containing protein [Myxococcota bacterium]
MPIPTSLVLSVLSRAGSSDDVSLAALAKRARRSPFDLHRAFKRVTGETTKRYTMRVRLDNAAAQLVLGDRAILDIALDSGFSSHEVFTRAFLRRFRMSPRAYRARGLAGGKQVAARHAAVVREAGPCIGLHHMPRHERTQIMSVTVTRQELQPRIALVIRKKCAPTEVAQTLGECLPRVFAWATQQGVAFAGPPFTRYLPSGPGLLSLEAGLPIAAPSKGEGDIIATELPGGPAAVAIHEGAYDKLAETHVAVERWIEANKLESAGSPWETYLTDPGETPDPADWRTEVVYPLRRG